MKIFKELKKIGYKHYTEHTVEELDDLPLDSEERIMEQALVLRWFREKYDLLCLPFSTFNEENNQMLFYFEIGKIKEFIVDVYSEDKPTYEEAELACLIKLIEIAKKQNNE